MRNFIENLKCCGNCKLFCNRKCPHKERIDDDQIEYYPPDYVCSAWISDGKNSMQRLITTSSIRCIDGVTK